MAKITYLQWEMMQLIHKGTGKMNGKTMYPYVHQCNKSILNTCLKKGYVELLDDGRYVRITVLGYEAAGEIAPLYND